MVNCTATCTVDVSLAQNVQKWLFTAAPKHGVISKVKYKKQVSEHKWTEMEYHVHDNVDVSHKYVKMF